VRGGKYPVYRCIAGYGGCAKVSIAGAKIEPWLVGMVTAYAQHYSHRLSTEAEAGADGDPTRKRAGLLSRLDEQASAFGDAVLTRAQFIRNKESIERELADVGTLDAAEIIRASERGHAFDVLEDWSAVDQQRQAAAIGSFVRVVTVFPVGRGSVLAPQYRAVVTWADDEADRSLSKLKDMLRAPDTAGEVAPDHRALDLVRQMRCAAAGQRQRKVAGSGSRVSGVIEVGVHGQCVEADGPLQALVLIRVRQASSVPASLSGNGPRISAAAGRGHESNGLSVTSVQVFSRGAWTVVGAGIFVAAPRHGFSPDAIRPHRP
jgi:hypothetical protein